MAPHRCARAGRKPARCPAGRYQRPSSAAPSAPRRGGAPRRVYSARQERFCRCRASLVALAEESGPLGSYRFSRAIVLTLRRSGPALSSASKGDGRGHGRLPGGPVCHPSAACSELTLLRACRGVLLFCGSGLECDPLRRWRRRRGCRAGVCGLLPTSPACSRARGRRRAPAGDRARAAGSRRSRRSNLGARVWPRELRRELPRASADPADPCPAPVFHLGHQQRCRQPHSGHLVQIVALCQRCSRAPRLHDVRLGGAIAGATWPVRALAKTSPARQVSATAARQRVAPSSGDGATPRASASIDGMRT